jgi:hypothetical protein
MLVERFDVGRHVPFVLLHGQTDLAADAQIRRVAFRSILVLSSSTKSGHPPFLNCQCPVDASADFSYRRANNLDRAGLPGHLFHAFLDRVGDLLDCLFGLPDYLVGLSFRAKLVVASQRTGGFLDSTFYYVCLATHDGDSFS